MRTVHADPARGAVVRLREATRCPDRHPGLLKKPKQLVELRGSPRLGRGHRRSGVARARGVKPGSQPWDLGHVDARFDRGPLAKLTHGETEQAPHGKPTGLSPPTSRTTCPDGLEGGLAVNPALPQAAPSPTHRAVSDGGVLLVGFA